jgi:formate hydrogenlyase subunit 6/NADH:ubiquinone oxidoreductase subunit I
MWKVMISQFRFLYSYIFRTIKTPPFTVEYPFVVKSLPGSSRTMIKNNFKECTGCMKCQEVCPVLAIEIEGFEYSKTMRRPTSTSGVPFEREIESFRVNYLNCVLCGLCVGACPTQSLSFAKNFLKPELAPKNLVVDLVHVPRSVRAGTLYEA